VTAKAARRSASSAPTRAPTKRTTFCRSLRGPCCGPTTSTTSEPRIMRPLRGLLPGTRIRQPACAIQLPLLQSCSSAAIRPKNNPLLAWNLRTNVRLNRGKLFVANANPIKLERQAKATLRLPADGLSCPRRIPVRQRCGRQERKPSARLCLRRSRCWWSSAPSTAARR